jgi:hypothetical protein
MEIRRIGMFRGERTLIRFDHVDLFEACAHCSTRERRARDRRMLVERRIERTFE